MTGADSERNVEDAKHEARARARAARCGIDAETCASASRAACERALGLREIASARLVLAYAATDEELDTDHLVEILRMRGVTIAFPRVETPGELGLHIVRDDDELHRGMFGILEPVPDAPRVGAVEVDAVIVPGVAFDQGCWRLGYGGGYYDRLLPLLKADCARIGLAYDEQVLGEIPAEEHDVRLDAVVTPTRVLRHLG